jgi:hypothetical protein
MAARKKERLETADGYIRVSRVAGREGEAFISPDVQRKKIEAWADLHGVQIVEWWEELDQSGGKRDRPMFQQALARCDAGETGPPAARTTGGAPRPRRKQGGFSSAAAPDHVARLQ